MGQESRISKQQATINKNQEQHVITQLKEGQKNKRANKSASGS
jgi:hypothetical protein